MGCSKLLLQNLEMRKEGPPQNSRVTGQQRDDSDDFGRWSGLSRLSKAISTRQLVHMINIIILGGY